MALTTELISLAQLRTYTIAQSTPQPRPLTPGVGFSCGYCCVDPAVILGGVMPPGLSEVVHRVSQWWGVASGGSGQFTRSSVSFFIFIIFFCIL